MSQKDNKGHINSMCTADILIIFWEYLKRIKQINWELWNVTKQASSEMNICPHSFSARTLLQYP